MVIETAIKEKLMAKLAPEALAVENESGMHNVPKGSETHFRVTIVSAAFEGLGRVERQRLVYSALREELAGGVHALTMTTKTPSEWASDPSAGSSPPCLGGSKHDATPPASGRGHR